mmetsp:Transcript_15165/g.21764  ORF Transcript_15165/g.21764 Transcript_15165/m.21764 type:complete len:93 (-) Transcript_15165:602-880(-)
MLGINIRAVTIQKVALKYAILSWLKDETLIYQDRYARGFLLMSSVLCQVRFLSSLRHFEGFQSFLYLVKTLACSVNNRSLSLDLSQQLPDHV